MKLKDRIVWVRENNYKTQKEVAELLGIAQSTYAEYENGKITPPLKRLCALACYFNVSLDYLLGLSKNKEPYGSMKSFDEKILSKNLTTLRKKYNYTQQNIAEKLSYSFKSISMYETNSMNMPIDTLIKFCKLYNISSDHLTGIVQIRL